MGHWTPTGVEPRAYDDDDDDDDDGSARGTTKSHMEAERPT